MRKKGSLNTQLTSIALHSSIACLSIASGISHAATITVNSNGDSGGIGCEFREAVTTINNGVINNNGCTVADGNAFGSEDTINIDSNSLSNNTVTLSGSQISINKDTIIQGFTGFTLDGDQASRVLEINNATVTMSILTITNGYSSTDSGGIIAYDSSLTLNNTAVLNNKTRNFGGGIAASGSFLTLNGSVVGGNISRFGGGAGIIAGSSTITLNNSTVRRNSADGLYSQGGGIGSYSSTLTLNNSIVSDNTAHYGGGVRGERSLITLNNSTVSGNSTFSSQVRGSGGGIYLGFQGTLILNNSTVSDNVGASNGGGISARRFSSVTLNNSTITGNVSDGIGNVAIANSSLSVRNSIISNAASGLDCFITVDASASSDNASIVGTGNCLIGRSVDPQLGPLADNGGTTFTNPFTHALKPNSPARNTGDLATCEIRDQRGQLRDDGDNACDVGAIEFNANDVFEVIEEIDDASFIVIPLPNNKAAVIPN